MPTTKQRNIYPHYYFALRSRIGARFIGTSIGGNNPPPGIPSCCEPCLTIPAFGDANSSDSDKNDYFTVVHTGLIDSDNFVFNLQKADSGGTFQHETILANSTHGTSIPKGSIADAPLIMGFTVEWKKILSLFGEGFYRIQAVGSGLVNYTHYSFSFCLKQYDIHRAHGTVRIDWVQEGKSCDVNNWRFRTDYGHGAIPMSIRVLGGFGEKAVTYTEHETEYQNGNIVQHGTEQSMDYTFRSGNHHYSVHNLLRHVAFPSGKAVVTDYNKNSKDEEMVQIPVLLNGGYKPNYREAKSILHRVEISLRDAKWDFRRTNC